ncbi:TetR/AcrR family transcriptional regulator [Mycobacterium sp. 236(2023)]|uniref:TetR/AcrR family transcriptional regulator n=1 Tax=Mycobacterium sp. 236(2023) TaxID=3038163 RepID=UPI0024151202|nr:TetR/AcrR family transcriptional regulator [Mycobacterium sp. 236(2023)]MDG4667186.1 TetR/AcrR family transcriptional regulator [Mycobacterium sp. 236(2023)]
MPKIVDHDERREEILSAAIRVIDTVGLESTTTRAIAHESGYSNGVLSHYFQDKDDILQSILVKTHREFMDRVSDSMRGKDAFGRLWAMLMQNLPLDDERRVETLMEITFWPRALSNPVLREFQREAASELLGMLRGLITDVRAAGGLDSDLTDADIAELLISVIDGMSVHAELFPKRLSSTYQKSLMRAQLTAIGFRVDAKV